MTGSGKGEVTFGGGWARAARALEVGVVACAPVVSFARILSVTCLFAVLREGLSVPLLE